MKPRNFPARKLKRQMSVMGVVLTTEQFDSARAIRTKKRRAGQVLFKS